MSKIITNGAVGHRILTLKQAMEQSPAFRPIDKKLLAKVRPEHYVKLWIEATSCPKPCAEIIWVRVVHRAGAKFKGEVRNQTKRSGYHGVKFLEILEFELKHILNLRIQDLDNEDKLRVFGVE